MYLYKKKFKLEGVIQAMAWTQKYIMWIKGREYIFYILLVNGDGGGAHKYYVAL